MNCFRMRRAGLIRPGTVPPPSPAEKRAMTKPFKIPERFLEDSDEEDVKPAKKSVKCEEVFDDEDLEATQPIVDAGPPPEDDAADSSMEEEDPEEEFRSHVNEVIREHGLEVVRGWFTCEARKFKKPKTEQLKRKK